MTSPAPAPISDDAAAASSDARNGSLIHHIVSRMLPVLAGTTTQEPPPPELREEPAAPDSATTATATNAREGRGRTARPDRAGKVLIGGWFEPALSQDLKRLALDEGKTLQAILGEAIQRLLETRKTRVNN